MLKTDKQKVIIFVLLGVIVGMTVGYSALSSILKIEGVSKVIGNWDIHFTTIDEGTMVDASNVNAEITNQTTATFTVNLQKPGSSAEYLVTVKNGGSYDAVVESITGVDEANAASPTDIIFEVSDIDVGTELNASGELSFKVKATWKPESTTIVDSNKQATISVNFIQQ